MEAKSVIPGFTERSFFSSVVYKSVSRLTLGLGPTSVISPTRTFQSWVSSSSLYLRMKCPIGVMRMSFTLVESIPEVSAFFIIERSFTILNGLKRLIFVEISLERGKDDPQRIFESLNSTGLDLSQSDLIRNFILMDLDHKNQTKIFEQIWNPIEENARDLIKQKSLVSDYIRDYLTLRNKKIPNKNNVYLEFKKLYHEKDENYTQELENIKSLSIHYKKLINPSSIIDTNLRKELEYISRLEINVAYPFLLQVFEDAENGIINRDDLIKILKLIQSYAWRRFIVGLPTNALNKIFMSLYSEIDTEDYYESFATALIRKRGSAKFPTNEDLKTALKDKDLYNIQSKNRNYMFELLENYNNREYVNTSNENITVEHIFPQNPNENWNKELSPEDYFLFKEKYVNTIANLTLSGNNGALSNKSFNDKKEMNKQDAEQGYNYSRLWLNDFLKTITIWNIANFNERFNLIYNRFLKIWEYPNVAIPISQNMEEQNLFIAELPTNKKLEYFIFENTKIEEDVIAQMFLYVIRKLYDKNAQLLLEAKDIIKITRNTSDFRAPQDLQNGYYIESNIDSNSKFSTLKKLLKLYELEDELLIKYADNENTGSPNRFNVRKEYWKQLLPLIKNTELFSNVNPSKDHWLSAGAGLSGLSYTFVITGKYVRIELSISTSSKEQNKKYFKKLLAQKETIENNFENKLEWEELATYKMSRIKHELNDVNLFDKNDWDKMNEFLVTNLSKFEKALQQEIKKLK